MDPNGLSQGRTFLMARGWMAVLFGIIALNGPDMSPTRALVLWGLWALADGTVTVLQAYQPSGTSGTRTFLLAMASAGLSTALLALFGLGLTTSALTWVLVGFFVVRAVFELAGALGGRNARVRTLLFAAGVLDLVLAGIFVNHMDGSVVGIAMLGGSLAALWGALHLVAALNVPRTVVVNEAGLRLLSPR